MIESRELKLHHTHISFEHVARLAKDINAIHQERIAKENHSEILFTILCFNQSELKANDISIFTNKHAIGDKHIQSISISYRSYDNNEKIDIKINHGNKVENNSAYISSPDNKWVNAVSMTIERALRSNPLPGNLVVDNYKPFMYATALCLGFIILMLVDALLKGTPLGDSLSLPYWYNEQYYGLSPAVYWPVRYGAAFLLGIKPTYGVTQRLIGLYPLVDLQTAEQRELNLKVKKNIFTTAAIIWSIPFIVSFIKIYIK